MSAGYGLPFEDDKNKDIVEVDESIWACPACTFHNDVTAVVCSMCETPRPALASKASKQPEAVTDIPSITVILLSGEELMTTDPSTCTNIIELKRGILEASRERGLDWSPDFLDLMPAEWVDIVRTRQVQAFCNRKETEKEKKERLEAERKKTARIEALMKRHLEGKTLNMYDPSYLGYDINADLKEVAAHCKDLSTIIVREHFFNDACLKEVAKYCKDLVRIDLHNTEVTDAGLKDAAPYLQHFQKIDVSFTKVTDSGLKDVAKHCKELRGIDVADTGVTDAGVQDAAPHFRNLTELRLWHTKVTDAGVKEVAVNCKNLENLSIGWTHFTDEGLKEVAVHCKDLKSIDVHLTNVTDGGLKEVAAHCKQLEYIRLDDTNVTEVGLKDTSKLLPACKFYKGQNRGYQKGQKFSDGSPDDCLLQ